MKMRLILLVMLALGVPAVAACGGGAETTAPAAETADPAALEPSIDVATAYSVRDNPAVFMLDVREPDEYAAGHIPGITAAVGPRPSLSPDSPGRPARRVCHAFFVTLCSGFFAGVRVYWALDKHLT